MSKTAMLAVKSSTTKRVKKYSVVRRKASSKNINSPVAQILHLQRTIGNQVVQSLFKSGKIQAKLKIGKPGDKYEIEADRIADKVMQMPESRVSRQPEEEKEEEGIQAKTIAEQISPMMQRQVEEEEEEESIQAKSDSIQQFRSAHQNHQLFLLLHTDD